MGREFRMVPPRWQHPYEWVKGRGTGNPDIRLRPLIAGFAEDAAKWDEEQAAWLSSESATGEVSFESHYGERPRAEDYMPAFAPGTATHFMMYEDVSEGSPISPAFATPEELARWLADNNAGALAGACATYEEWLRVCRGGYAPTMVVSDGALTSGVAGLSDT